MTWGPGDGPDTVCEDCSATCHLCGTRVYVAVRFEHATPIRVEHLGLESARSPDARQGND